MEPADSPILALIRQRMTVLGFTRRELGHLLATVRNATKTFRRLDQLLRSERFLPEFIQRIADVLQIDAGQLAVAREAHVLWEQERQVERGRWAMEEAMARRGPHLWGIMPPGYSPSLFTILGAEFFLLVMLPMEVTRLPHYEQMHEVGKCVREHFLHQRRCELVGYEYRRSLHAVFRFDVGGEYLGRVDGDPLDSRTFVRVGGRKVETTGGQSSRRDFGRGDNSGC